MTVRGQRMKWIVAYYIIVIGLSLIFFSAGYMTPYKKRKQSFPSIKLLNGTHGDFVPPNMTHSTSRCTPKVDCIQKNYAVLHQLKAGTIKPSTKKRMIYLKTMGRFGNILYEFAALLALAKATCAVVKVSSDHRLQEIFDQVPFEVLADADFNRLTTGIPYFNLHNNHTPEEMAIKTALKQDVQLRGVFADSRWFSGCVDDVKYKIRLKDEFIETGRKNIKEIMHKHGRVNATTVGVHVRRGDKVKKKNYKLPTIAYFGKAMSYFKQRHQNVLFIVTSDDRIWVMKKFIQLQEHYSDIVIAPKTNFQIDFAVLFQCDYVIQSEGTFSQWAAIMNGHESVYFEGYRAVIWPNWMSISG